MSINTNETSPQAKHARRWFQFSLRTIFLLTLFIAIGTFFGVIYANRYSEFRVVTFDCGKERTIIITAQRKTDNFFVAYHRIFNNDYTNAVKDWFLFADETSDLRFELVTAENSNLVGILQVFGDGNRRLAFVHDFSTAETLPDYGYDKPITKMLGKMRLEELCARLRNENPTLPDLFDPSND